MREFFGRNHPKLTPFGMLAAKIGENERLKWNDILQNAKIWRYEVQNAMQYEIPV
jgi:hypothetical protein